MSIFISALHERKLRSKFSQSVSMFDTISPDFQGRSAPKARSVSSSALGAGAREDLRWECIVSGLCSASCLGRSQSGFVPATPC